MATGRHFSSGNDAPMQTSPMSGAAGVRPVRTAAAGNTRSAASGMRKVPSTKAQRFPRWNKPVKPVVAIALAAALALVGVGGVLAWLVSTDSLTNTFGVGEIETVVTEDFNGESKSNVAVQNNGNVDAWIRAQINIYWVDSDGNQMWDKPAKGIDYSLTMGSQTAVAGDNSWVQGQDGYYYFDRPVAPNASTDKLIDTLKDANAYDDGRKLVCDINAQAIQADPYSAVQDSWGVTVISSEDGDLSLRKEDGKVAVTSSNVSTESEVA